MRFINQLGKYRLLRELGKGGFATVYLGEHIYLKKQVAIKILHVGHNPSNEEMNAFLVEAQTVAQLEHPHIISILDYDIEKHIPYLVMAYAPNGSLHLRHDTGIILPPQTILSYVKQIASALQFAHDHRIVHCDVKPENMLLNANDEIQLSDFGIAVILHDNLKTCEVVGTMNYMAPEQFIGKPEPASDQYGLAVLMYRWLCGQFPLQGRNPVEWAQLHNFVPPRPLHELNPTISLAIEEVILTALAKKPDQRFPRIQAFVQAFEQALSHSASSHSIPAPSKRPSPSYSMDTPPAQESKNSDPLPFLPSSRSLIPPLPPRKVQEVESSSTSPQIVSSRSSEQTFAENTMPHLVYRQHSSWVAAVLWSPDGTLIASSSWDTTVHLWYAQNAKNHLIYHGHIQPVKSLAWSPDGALIASGSWDNTVQIWDVSNGTLQTKAYLHAAQVETVAWSPDGRYIASAGHDSTIQVWKASNQRSVTSYTSHRGPIWSISWSPDSTLIASAGHDKTVRLWQVQTGQTIQIYDQHNARVTAVAWSPDGRLIASGDHDGIVQVWDAQGGTMLLNYRDSTGAVKALTWSSKSLQIASAVRTVQLRDITQPSLTDPLLLYTGHSGWVNSLSWSPDGSLIASASDDKTVHIWNCRLS